VEPFSIFKMKQRACGAPAGGGERGCRDDWPFLEAKRAAATRRCSSHPPCARTGVSETYWRLEPFPCHKTSPS
jgi:hypothetical protein